MGLAQALRSAARQAVGQSKVAFAADHEFRVLDQRTGRRREAFDAVLADANYGKPALLTGAAHDATPET